MNKASLAVAVLACLGVATTAGASTLFGPKGTFKAGILDKLSYSPEAACYKPMRPFSKDRFAWSQYQREAEIYLDCLKSATESDMTFARSVMQDGYEAAAQDFLRYIENVF